MCNFQIMAVLQIRRGNWDNLKIILSTFLHENIFYDSSFELSLRDGSNEGSQHMLMLKNKK